MDPAFDEEDNFDAAAEQLTLTIASGTKVADSTLLDLYGLYKQGTEGPCKKSKPSILDPKGRSKWKAWHDLGSLSREEARDTYVVTVRQLLGGAADGEEQPATYGAAGPAMSTPTEALGGSSNEETGDDEGGPLHAALAEGDMTRFVQALEQARGDQLEQRDADGCTPLHRAADAGNTEALELLIARSASLNLQDNEGMTPLHYAALAGRQEAYLLLLGAGADGSIQDQEGELASNLIPTHWDQIEQKRS